jgi:peptidoglycan/LPS O-acetylase OafA/YrhL
MEFIADLIDPLLGVLIIAWPLILWRAKRTPSRPWRFAGASLLAIGMVYLLTYVDHRFRLWAAFSLDFSTHTAVAVSLITSLGILDRRSLFFLVPVLCFYAWLMLRLGYHSALDVITAALITVPLTLVMHWLCGLSGRARRSELKPERGGI